MKLLHKKREMLVGLFAAVLLQFIPIHTPVKIVSVRKGGTSSLCLLEKTPLKVLLCPILRSWAVTVYCSAQCRDEEMSRGSCPWVTGHAGRSTGKRGCVAGTAGQAAQDVGGGGSSLCGREGSCWCRVLTRGMTHPAAWVSAWCWMLVPCSKSGPGRGGKGQGSDGRGGAGDTRRVQHCVACKVAGGLQAVNQLFLIDI